MSDSSYTRDVVDSLPYIDRQLEEVSGLRETAESLIQHELLNSSSSLGVHPRMPKRAMDNAQLFANAPAFSSLLAQYPTEPLSALDTLRYQLPDPSTNDSEPSEDDWRSASDNARIQLEHLNTRSTNLSLLSSFGPNAHLIHNHLLEAEAKQLESTLNELKAQVVDVNRKRKNSQVETEAVLTRLETQWTQLISSTLQTELANAALEAEVEGLRKREKELGLDA